MRELTSDPLPRNQHLHLNAEMQILQQAGEYRRYDITMFYMGRPYIGQKVPYMLLYMTF